MKIATNLQIKTWPTLDWTFTNKYKFSIWSLLSHCISLHYDLYSHKLILYIYINGQLLVKKG